MSRQHAATSGFSLPELMVAMAVLGILCGISIVNLSQQLGKERLLAASRETHSWLDTQRRIAMTDATACEIAIDTAKATLKPSGTSIELVNNNEIVGTLPNACSNQAAIEIRKTVSNGSGITLSITPANISTIRFSMRGLSEIITSDGTQAAQLEMKLNQPGIPKQRCIKVISPLALIRTGSAPANSQTCSYSSSF